MSQTDIPDWENELTLYLTSAGDRRRTISFIQSLLERQTWEIVNLRADLDGAMGHMQGCGHTWEYLEKRYPEFKEKSK